MNGRRGVVFTLVALIMVAYLLASDRVSDRFTVDSASASVATTRVTVLDAYLVSLEEHASASLATAGYLTFGNLSKSVNSNGTYVDNLNATLVQCMLLNRIAISNVIHPCLPDAALINTSMNALAAIGAQELGVTTRYVLHNVTVTETLPFEVVLRLEFSYNITDAFGSFQRDHRNVTATIDLRGVEDPVYSYLRNTGVIDEPVGSHAFKQTHLLRFMLNWSTFPTLYQNNTYVANEGQAPSILQRYQGQVSATSACCGIESVVRRGYLVEPVDPNFMNYSLVDHQLVRHLAGTLPEYSCSNNEVRAFTVPNTGGVTVVLETSRYDNLYNLTNMPTVLPQCSWS